MSNSHPRIVTAHAAASTTRRPFTTHTSSTTYSSTTLIDQKETEISCDDEVKGYYTRFFTSHPECDGNTEAADASIHIDRSRLSHFLNGALGILPAGYTGLDASRTWICYWSLHAMDVSGSLHACLEDFYSESHTTSESDIDTKVYKAKLKIGDWLLRCQHPSGGFGGGPDQQAHLAPTYAAINSLVILGLEELWRRIDRRSLYTFLFRMKRSDGSFTMHEGGEEDVRGCYTALCCARLTNILTAELMSNVGEHVARCQTYEGGIGATRYSEAHGGYTFCGLAASILTEKHHLIDLASLYRWLALRQGPEGGFQGRTNKLVDSCYSFWQGGCFVLLFSYSKWSMATASEDEQRWADHGWGYDTYLLQRFIMVTAQHPSGGFKDKPKKRPDYYHTCYAISGLSLSQHQPCNLSIVGAKDNLLHKIDPIHNISVDKIKKCLSFFQTYEDNVGDV